jgi:hypothetical protein
MQGRAISVTWKAGENEVAFSLDEPFRLRAIRTNVRKENVGFITGLYINNGANQLLAVPGHIDAYHWSQVNIQRIQQEFLEKHQLTDKTPDEIAEYCDANEVAPLDPTRIEGITLEPGWQVRITGSFSENTAIVLLGVSPVPSPRTNPITHD